MMRVPVSVVVITKNEAAKIAACIQSARMLTDDVVVVDAMSTDNTQSIAREEGATVVGQEWLGYGYNRNVGALHAKYDWVFSLDADERFSDELMAQIRGIDFEKNNLVYSCRRRSYIGSKAILHGDWAHDVVTRLYNKKITAWNNAQVHEHIELKGCDRQKLQGFLLHYSFEDTDQLFRKARYYSRLNAEKYLNMPSKKRNAGMKMVFSPMMAFIKTYLLRAGFLDGKEGLAIANAAAFSAYMRYKLFRQLDKEQQR